MNRELIFSLLRRLWSTIPITLILVLIVVCLEIAVDVRTSANHNKADAYRNLGVLEIRHSAEYPNLFGPFDLWAGQWWRVPMGGLHQGGWWQLAVIVPAVVFVGFLLEPRLHPVMFGFFFVGALFVTTLARWQFPEIPGWFAGEDPITGLGGVIFAAFGVLLVLRQHDGTLNRQLGDGGILLGAICGLGCLALSIGGWITGVDNLAHIVGFFYGLVWSMVLSAPATAIRFWTAALVAGHGFLWMPFDQIMHPAENGRYHWWLAETTDDEAFKTTCYRNAVTSDPTLAYPWYALAEQEFRTGRPREAWESLLGGLKRHPELKHAEHLSPQIWRRFATPTDRKEALAVLARIFPRDPAQWRDRLLSPRQSALFLMETGAPLDAWRSCMRLLNTIEAPRHSKRLSPDIPEAQALARSIWNRLNSQTQQAEALGVMDEILEGDRRAWHLVLIPNRVLISHYQNLGELLWAWQAVMTELRTDSGFRQEGKRIAGEIWKSLPTELRRERAGLLWMKPSAFADWIGKSNWTSSPKRRNAATAWINPSNCRRGNPPASRTRPRQCSPPGIPTNPRAPRRASACDRSDVSSLAKRRRREFSSKAVGERRRSV